MKTETLMIASDLEKKNFTCEAWEDAECIVVSLEAPKTVPRLVHKEFIRETLLDAGYEDGMFEIFNIDRLVCVRAIVACDEYNPRYLPDGM
jgi:hypothetical protein